MDALIITTKKETDYTAEGLMLFIYLIFPEKFIHVPLFVALHIMVK